MDVCRNGTPAHGEISLNRAVHKTANVYNDVFVMNATPGHPLQID